jgi:hypothetical protein
MFTHQTKITILLRLFGRVFFLKKIKMVKEEASLWPLEKIYNLTVLLIAVARLREVSNQSIFRNVINFSSRK